MSTHQRRKKLEWPSDKSRTEKNRTRQHTSRSTEIRHRSNHKHALSSIQKDLGGGTSADRLERRTPHQDSKERGSEQI
ncbi:unnamed protein product [Schistosoma mattheei]|uniref:Uncharacterized protein n=1 Tax=Schistosoma mattheei TaxID=31246 RepID=A0A183Q2J0_9TREM|nr:unnamed protein product [Schistosoma mattheei]